MMPHADNMLPPALAIFGDSPTLVPTGAFPAVFGVPNDALGDDDFPEEMLDLPPEFPEPGIPKISSKRTKLDKQNNKIVLYFIVKFPLERQVAPRILNGICLYWF